MTTNNSNTLTEGLLLEKDGEEAFLHAGMEITMHTYLNEDDEDRTTITGEIIKINESNLEIRNNKDGYIYTFDLGETDDEDEEEEGDN